MKCKICNIDLKTDEKIFGTNTTYAYGPCYSYFTDDNELFSICTECYKELEEQSIEDMIVNKFDHNKFLEAFMSSFNKE